MGAHVCTVAGAICAYGCEEVRGQPWCFSARAVLGHSEAGSLTNLEFAYEARCQRVLSLPPQSRDWKCVPHGQYFFNPGAGDLTRVLMLGGKRFTDWAISSSL